MSPPTPAHRSGGERHRPVADAEREMERLGAVEVGEKQMVEAERDRDRERFR